METPITIGDVFTFRKTVSESDVYQFAGITGDLSPNHVDEEAMKKTRYGGRIAHGALLIGYMSYCSTAAVENAHATDWGIPVSLGYDKIRFINAVKIGETIEITYQFKDFEPLRARARAEVILKVNGETCCVADHILAWVKEE